MPADRLSAIRRQPGPPPNIPASLDPTRRRMVSLGAGCGASRSAAGRRRSPCGAPAEVRRRHGVDAVRPAAIPDPAGPSDRPVPCRAPLRRPRRWTGGRGSPGSC